MHILSSEVTVCNKIELTGQEVKLLTQLLENHCTKPTDECRGILGEGEAQAMLVGFRLLDNTHTVP